MLLLWAVVSTGVAQAAGRVALVIGNGSYSEDIGELNNTINDAVAIRKLLKQLDFDVQMELDLDREAMVEVISDFSTGTKGADAALIFYAGHGAEVNGKNILFPVDLSLPSALTEEELLEIKPLGSKRAQSALLREKRLSALEAGTVSLELLSSAAFSRSERAIIIVDACRDDAFNRMVDIKNVTSALRRQGRAKGALYAFAAAPGEPALDGGGENSPFTSALLKYLGTPGQDITIAMKLVQQEVYDKTGGLQLPYIVSGLPSSFIPNRSVSALAEREQLLLAMAELTIDDKKLVERVARRNQNMPLAPLYASLLTRGAVTFAEKELGLQEAASTYAKFQSEIERLQPGDSRVDALTTEAKKLMQLGEVKGAWERLSEAIEINRIASAELAGRLTSRMLIEADMLRLRASVSLISFDRGSAIKDLQDEVELYEKVMQLGEELGASSKNDYGEALISLGEQLRLMGDSSQSLNAYQRAKEYFYELETFSSKDSQWIIGEVKALINMSAILLERSNVELAFSMATHGLERIRSFGNSSILSHELIHLSAELNNVLVTLNIQVGSIDAAISYLETSIGARKSILISETHGYEAKFGLSWDYSLQSDLLKKRGNLVDSYAVLDDAFIANGELLSSEPENLELRYQLATFHLARADLLELQGDLDAAIESLERYQSTLSELLAIDPSNVYYQSDIADGLNYLGHVYEVQGNTAKAINYFEEHLDLSEELSRSDPQNMDWQFDLAASFNRLATINFSLGNLEKSIEYYLRDLEISKKLVEYSPRRTDWIEGLALTYHWLAKAYDALGDSQSSMKMLLSDVELREKLHVVDPSNAEWQHQLSVAYASLSGGYQMRGELDEALHYLLKDLSLSQSLVSQDPTNLRWKEALSGTHVMLGSIYEDKKQITLALHHANESLALRRTLVSYDPTNAEWKSGLSVAYNVVGRLQFEVGDLGRALDSFLKDLDIAQTLVEDDPQNALWKEGLAGTYSSLGRVYEAQGELDMAIEMNMAGLFIVKSLLSKDQSNFYWQEHFLQLQTQLTAGLRLQGKHEEGARNLIGALSYAMANDTEIRKNKLWSESVTEACDELSEFGDLFNGYEYDEYTNASDFCRNWISN